MLCLDKDETCRLLIYRSGNTFRATTRHIPEETEILLAGGVIESSLFATVDSIGEMPQLAGIVADLFAWDIDFIKDLRKGDAFRVIVEKKYREGRSAGYGRVLAAEFVNRKTAFHAFYYEDPEGRTGYYNMDGSSMRKQFLRAPLRYSRISSGYSHRRFHPILKRYRPHLAVDYAAPRGTPVHTIGDGTVIFCGRKGPNGKMVKIRHNGIYTTAYIHLSRYGRGIKKGTRVKQGQVIGYVGSTGRATGPHLDFSIYKNGRRINPLTYKNPPSHPVKEKHLEDFFQKRDALALKLTRIKPGERPPETITAIALFPGQIAGD
jgi:murein DD-endopeptidase MepM/ murein hydrolase activator NlpD